jgi:hypothetical protein
VQPRISRSLRSTSVGVRALASGNGIANATVAVLLEWSPETPEHIKLSLFGQPFQNDQSFELQTGPCRGAVNLPGVMQSANEDVSVVVSTDGQIFTITIPHLAPIMVDEQEDDEIVMITVCMPAEGVREFLNSTR